MDVAKQRLSLEELLQRLEVLGVAMRSYADSSLDSWAKGSNPLLPMSQPRALVKTDSGDEPAASPGLA